MSGYIKSTRLISVNENIDWNRSLERKNVFETKASDSINRQESLLTFRSGKRYHNAINGGGVDLVGSTLNHDYGREIGDRGHVYDHQKVQMYTTHPRVDLKSPDAQYRYRGPLFFIPWYVSGLPQSPEGTNLGLSANELNVRGAKGIQKSYPTKPAADLAVALAELLREGLPSMIFATLLQPKSIAKKHRVKAAADEYLNYMFGISPLIKEAEKLFKLINDADKILRQLARDSGNVVRRRATVEDSTQVIGITRMDMNFYNVLGHNLGGVGIIPGSYSCLVTQTLNTRVWFSGAFQYYLPSSFTDVYREGYNPDLGETVEGASAFIDVFTHIAGLRATPKAAWNLAGFSWLVDWFLNIGDFLENVDAFSAYGLVMPYGYVMAESRLVTSYSCDPKFGSIKNVSNNVVVTRQQRARATPYGFGLKDTDFGPYQKSILTALGISKAIR